MKIAFPVGFALSCFRGRGTLTARVVPPNYSLPKLHSASSCHTFELCEHLYFRSIYFVHPRPSKWMITDFSLYAILANKRFHRNILLWDGGANLCFYMWDSYSLITCHWLFPGTHFKARNYISWWIACSCFRGGLGASAGEESDVGWFRVRKGDKHADSKSGLVLEEPGELCVHGLQPQASGELVVSPLGDIMEPSFESASHCQLIGGAGITSFSFWPQARRGTATLKF